ATADVDDRGARGKARFLDEPERAFQVRPIPAHPVGRLLIIDVVPVSFFVHQVLVLRSRKAFPMTETELKLIAAAAMIGLRKMPANGYRMPAAIGTPTQL